MAVHADVYIEETVGGRSINVTGIRKNLKVKEVENFGGTGSVMIINGMTPATNLLSASYSGWSSGTGAIAPGMYLRIPGIGIYIITDITPADDVINVTFGDCIQILRATGGEYFRDHYVASQQHNMEYAYGQWSGGKCVLTKPSGVTLRANGDIQWAVAKNLVHDGPTPPTSSITKCIYRPGANEGWGDYRIYNLDWELDWIYGVKVYAEHELNCKIATVYNYNQLSGQTFSGRSAGELTIMFNAPTRTVEGGVFLLRVYDLLAQQGVSGNDVYNGELKMIEKEGHNWEFRQRCIKVVPSSSQEFEDGFLTGLSIKAEFIGSRYAGVTSGHQTGDTQYAVDAVNGVAALDQSHATPPHDGRATITYKSMSGGLSRNTVFSRICDAAGCSCSVPASSRAVGIFRCGGAPYYSYLAILADMDEPGTGRQYSIVASRQNWMSLSVGLRRRATDAQSMTLYYGGDAKPTADAVVMKRFIPTKTMRYRPSMAVTRGTGYNGQPIIMTVRDPNVDVGATESIVSGSTASVPDAALASYSKIITNRSRDWEGTVELSGIYPDMITNGTYTGGITVRIYDSRYGMSGYAAKVREVEYDYHNQTTTLTLNNYSEIYSSSLVDTSKMAYSAGNMSAEATSNDMFSTQYIFLETYASVGSGNPTVYAYLDNQTIDAPGDVVRMPELGIAIVSAYFERDIAKSSTSQYAVSAVSVNGTTISIPASRRVDKYSDQALIVNIQMRL